MSPFATGAITGVVLSFGLWSLGALLGLVVDRIEAARCPVHCERCVRARFRGGA